MPSVIVSWTGQCREGAVRQELCNKLTEIADVADSFVGANPDIKRFDQRIGGKILLAGTALEAEDLNRALDAETSPETSTGLSPVSSSEDLAVDESMRLVHTLRLSGPDSSAIFSLRDAALCGIEFRLPTYRDEDRISFVFMLCANPALNGLIVQAENKQQGARFESETIRGADWFLHNSSIHLRYRFEEWMDLLLGWVKHFYIRDLRYWRYEPLSNYEWLFSKTDSDDKQAQDQLFDVLKESLAMEFMGWPHIQGKTWTMSFWKKLETIETWAPFQRNLSS